MPVKLFFDTYFTTTRDWPEIPSTERLDFVNDLRRLTPLIGIFAPNFCLFFICISVIVLASSYVNGSCQI